MTSEPADRPHRTAFGPDWGQGHYEHSAARPLPAIYEPANEEPGGFRITSRYVVASAHRGACHPRRR